jgi:hypothetical protein
MKPILFLNFILIIKITQNIQYFPKTHSSSQKNLPTQFQEQINKIST